MWKYRIVEEKGVRRILNVYLVDGEPSYISPEEMMWDGYNNDHLIFKDIEEAFNNEVIDMEDFKEIAPF